MYKNRKDIEKFLWELDKFLYKYYEIDKTFHNVFTSTFKINAKNRAWINSDTFREMKFHILDRLCNNFSQWKIVLKAKRKSELDKHLKIRKAEFVQSVAYKFEYKQVRDISYEHIFIKIAIWWWANIPYREIVNWYLEKHSDALNTFLVPIDWETNDDLVIY
jgi:hypothetical protein